MPTENRSTDMVSVPRGLVERIADHCNFWKEHPYLEAISNVEGDLRAILAQPAEQYQSEPVTWMKRGLKGSFAGQLAITTEMVMNPALYEGPFPVFRHPYTAEVEHLRAEVKRLDLLVAQADYNYDHDRANFKRQLAERDALLKSSRKAQQRLIETAEEFCMRHGASFGHFDAARRNIKAIDAALSASAEPEAKS